jgi:thioredoxin 1
MAAIVLTIDWNLNMNQDEKLNAETAGLNFEPEVLRSKRPVLVAFLSPWSQPCQVLRPVLDKVARACAGRVKVVKLNADDCPGLGLEYAIQFIPTLLVFVDGAIRARIVGTASVEAILSELRPVLDGGDSEKAKPAKG